MWVDGSGFKDCFKIKVSSWALKFLDLYYISFDMEISNMIFCLINYGNEVLIISKLVLCTAEEQLINLSVNLKSDIISYIYTYN